MSKAIQSRIETLGIEDKTFVRHASSGVGLLGKVQYALGRRDQQGLIQTVKKIYEEPFQYIDEKTAHINKEMCRTRYLIYMIDCILHRYSRSLFVQKNNLSEMINLYCTHNEYKDDEGLKFLVLERWLGMRQETFLTKKESIKIRYMKFPSVYPNSVESIFMDINHELSPDRKESLEAKREELTSLLTAQEEIKKKLYSQKRDLEKSSKFIVEWIEGAEIDTFINEVLNLDTEALRERVQLEGKSISEYIALATERVDDTVKELTAHKDAVKELMSL